MIPESDEKSRKFCYREPPPGGVIRPRIETAHGGDAHLAKITQWQKCHVPAVSTGGSAAGYISGILIMIIKGTEYRRMYRVPVLTIFALKVFVRFCSCPILWYHLYSCTRQRDQSSFESDLIGCWARHSLAVSKTTSTIYSISSGLKEQRSQ